VGVCGACTLSPCRWFDSLKQHHREWLWSYL
jgi:hypothetical protein